MPQKQRLLFLQNTGLIQLQEHPFHPVGMLVDIFNKHDATGNIRHPARPRQMCQHRQVAAPQRPFYIHIRIIF